MAESSSPLTYEQKYEKYKKYQEILSPRHHHKKCPTCYVVINNKASRCQWCRQALEAAKNGNKTFKEARAVLEILKREIERTDEKNIDLTLAVMQSKVMMKYRPDHYIWYAYPFYKRPEVNLGSLRPYKQVSDTKFQKNKRFLIEQNSPNRKRLRAVRTITEYQAKEFLEQKLAKKEANRMADSMHNYAREDKGLGSRDDRSFGQRQSFYDYRINKPKYIGSKDFSK
jgi:hypothetical protein